ncbi:MAG TPA: polysaccharide biosynthesis/export family protein [Terriglobales bacterium]|nr:polysaccharide biosynthesis/export family protein [Terriglobales bacterium]
MGFGVLARNIAALMLMAGMNLVAQTATPSVKSLPPLPTDTSAGPAQAPGASTDAITPVRDLTIGIGDLLKISVMGAPEYDQDVRVSGSGDVFLGLVGKVHVAGETPDEAEQEIRKRMISGGYFTDPQVSVLQKEFATQGVSVLGEVQRPGVYPVTGPRRLFDILSLAGGTTAKAGQTITVASRDKDKGPRTVTLSSDPEKNMEANVDIRPGDTVVVSKAGVVYVVGEVRHPMGVIMDNTGQITILQALATAEGPSSTANLHNARIVRKGKDGPTEFPVDIKKIMEAKAPDTKLQAEDIVFIPSSTARNVGVRTLQSIVNIASGIATYRAVY